MPLNSHPAREKYHVMLLVTLFDHTWTVQSIYFLKINYSQIGRIVELAVVNFNLGRRWLLDVIDGRMAARPLTRVRMQETRLTGDLHTDSDGHNDLDRF